MFTQSHPLSQSRLQLNSVSAPRARKSTSQVQGEKSSLSQKYRPFPCYLKIPCLSLLVTLVGLWKSFCKCALGGQSGTTPHRSSLVAPRPAGWGSTSGPKFLKHALLGVGKSGRFHGAPGECARLHVNFGDIHQSSGEGPRIHQSFGEGSRIHQSSGEGPFCMGWPSDCAQLFVPGTSFSQEWPLYGSRTQNCLNGPKWTVLVHFGPANATIQFGKGQSYQTVVLTILDHFGPVCFPALLRPLFIQPKRF